MLAGSIVDLTKPVICSWIEGIPERVFLGVKVKGKEQMVLTAFPCTRCGFLESYADEA